MFILFDIIHLLCFFGNLSNRRSAMSNSSLLNVLPVASKSVKGIIDHK